jgi:hypothetical protein
MKIGDSITHNGRRCVVVGFRSVNGAETILIARVQ